MSNVPLVDLVAQYHSIQPEIDEAISGVLESGEFILGSQVSAFEQEMAAYLGVKYAIGVASGTDALVLALRSAGVQAEDEVIVPAYSFFATASAVLMLGAKPVFVDVEAGTYLIDCAQVESLITPKTKAVVPVHLYGQPAEMDPLLEISERHGLAVIEDNAQAIGAEYGGRKTGSIGRAGCLSFFPSKNLGGYGDGGMVVTGDAAIAEQVRMLRTHGWKRKYFPEVVGYNSRLDALQAAILRVKLRHLDDWIKRRQEIAAQYDRELRGLPVDLPRIAPGRSHVFHCYCVGFERRDTVQSQLQEAGIATAVYYPQPLHLTAPCQAAGYHSGQFPISEYASRSLLALPIYPELGDIQIAHICGKVRDIVLSAT